MSFISRDIVVGIAALIAFPMAINLPAVLAGDGSPDRGLPLFERGESGPVHARADLPR
jgi:hypothetical protein